MVTTNLYIDYNLKEKYFNMCVMYDLGKNKYICALLYVSMIIEVDDP